MCLTGLYQIQTLQFRVAASWDHGSRYQLVIGIEKFQIDNSQITLLNFIYVEDHFLIIISLLGRSFEFS